MKSLGICIGASNISIALIEKKDGNINVLETRSAPHEGNPKKLLRALINADLLDSVHYFAITGRKLRHMLNAPSISEPEALEYACRFSSEGGAKPEVIVSAGGETFMVYRLDQTGRIIDVHTGNKCASGTGEFFLQQLKRMDLSIEEAIKEADMDSPYKVAGRCSVFCKSDCTHALNKGAPKGSIVAGLCEMMSGKVLELLKKTCCENVYLIGGTSKNSVMVDFLRKKIPGLYIPEHATTFEALGTALWAMDNEAVKEAGDINSLYIANKSSFSFLPPLKEHIYRVSFKNMSLSKAQTADKCIIGLDVGSTTTKAVVMRENDNAILASCYLRTNGDPVGASKQCYEELQKQIETEINILGLGVTGSGRHIAGLYSMTPAVINEIVAHAAAAVYFDPDVDTIFEIGGQDAKYTHLTNGVPSDYAMNEACSAGTGSFLEEAAKESLDIDTEEIGDIALQSQKPPNFNDQCAAFISSDIKSAIQEGIDIVDIAAGLVYSICMNYSTRVKGNRVVGEKIFMQGGVCYNRAVPVAMAALIGKHVIVPPEPGLMGAFGVALEVKKRLKLGFLKPAPFNLKELSSREISYLEPFICTGGTEKCDRKCSVNRIVISGSTYPFGGACSKYYNIFQQQKGMQTTDNTDYTRIRERMIFEDFGKNYSHGPVTKTDKCVGINNSLLTNSLYPLYHNFFTALGFRAVITDKLCNEGIEQKGAAFCYPVEIAHGNLSKLIELDPDFYFLPQVKSLPVKNGVEASVVCPLIQAEPFYLKSTFKGLKSKNLLTPVLDLADDYENGRDTFVSIGKTLGLDSTVSNDAFSLAIEAQEAFHKKCRALGSRVLGSLERNPDKITIVLFGRPYNAFVKMANMGIPKKFSSRGYEIIPFDFLPYENEPPAENMYWAMGQMLLKAAKYVKKHPQLFAVYITNFSCGPDSFLVGYFRDIMGKKPSLTLELDSHTADAGIDTRVEAFLDVIKAYTELHKSRTPVKNNPFVVAEVVTKRGRILAEDSRKNVYPITDPKVHVLIPSMGEPGSRFLASAMQYVGINASSLPAPTEKELKTGQGYVSCKECLPLILTVGSLLNYLKERRTKGEVLLYFMPETSGPCRFGQYNILIKNVIEKMQIEDVALFSLTSENGYAGFGAKLALRAWQAAITADVLDDVHNSILVLAKDKRKAMAIYDRVCEQISHSLAGDTTRKLFKTLKRCASLLKSIELTQTIEQRPKVALIGEIYVRRDGFSRQYLTERLADKGIIVRTAPILEWLYYCDYIVKKRLVVRSDMKDRLRTYIQQYFKIPFERMIKEIFAQTGLYSVHMIDVEKTVNNAADLISPRLTGEAILTTGSAITEIVEEVDGVISIGPFGCMPSRIAEAVINKNMHDIKAEIAEDKRLINRLMEQYPSLPFLPIESDGNTFPQLIEVRLEAFCLQVERIHSSIKELKSEMDKGAI